MTDDEAKPRAPKLRWFQISLRTLLALVLGFGLGLALNYRFRTEESSLPNPGNIRRGDRVRVEWRPSEKEWTTHTATVLADGSIRLRELGGVPAAGMSMDELSEDLRSRYQDYATKLKRDFWGGKQVTVEVVEVFVDFGSPSGKE